jgi:hypothetical protein
MRKPLLYFFLPFLLLAVLMVWTSFRISRPDEALEHARGFLEEKVPGAEWQVTKMRKLGEGLNKKWRIELSVSQKDGRVAQANLVVDRWRPSRVVGKFVVIMGPPQILDGGWEKPAFWDSFSPKIPLMAYMIAGWAFLGFQCFWLYRVRRRGEFFRRDGIILALMGFGLLWNQAVLEVRPAFLAGYAVVASFVVWTTFSAIRKTHGS